MIGNLIFSFFLVPQNSEIFEKYKQVQKIGPFYAERNRNSDFMTEKIVILFPEDLIDYSEKFKKARCDRNRLLRVSRGFSFVNK